MKKSNVIRSEKRILTTHAGALPRPLRRSKGRGLPQELEDALLGGVGQRQGRDAHRLTGRQRLRVRRFLVQVGVRQVGRTRLQHVDQLLGEVLAVLNDRQVRAQGARRGGQRVAGAGQGRQGLVDVRVQQEVAETVLAGRAVRVGDRGQAEAVRGRVDRGDVEVGATGVVELDVHVIALAGNEVDAVVAGVAGELRDLVEQVVVLVL